MTSLHDLHPIVAAALGDGVPVPHPLRATGPQPPWLAPRSWARAALWLAERALVPATEIERDVLDETAQLLGVAVHRPVFDSALRGSDARLDLAELARKVAEHADRKLAGYVQEDAIRLARSAMQWAPEPASVLHALDDEVFRLEAAQLVETYGEPGESVSSVLFRAEGARGRLGLCVVRLTTSYGIVVRLKGRHRWFHGSRADVLSTIPDALLSKAVDVVVACESRGGLATRL